MHRTPVLDEAQVLAALGRMAQELRERIPPDDPLVLVGIQRRGVPLASWLAQALAPHRDAPPETGSLDITLYRDDLMAIGPRPVVGETRLPRSGLDDRTVVLVDDVLYTGRTVRAALDELIDFGRPRRILLAVLVDRGGRELPIQPDVVGVRVDVPAEARIEVRVPDIDGSWGVDRVEPATQRA